jgi:hypothetical protein
VIELDVVGGLQPVLQAWPKFAHIDFQIATKIDVTLPLEWHRPRATGDLAEIFNRHKYLAIVFVIRVDQR